MTSIKIDKIIRSKRRTWALEIARDARLIVRVPEKTPLDYIEKIVLRKRVWIEEKQRVAREQYEKAQPKEFVDGERFLYLGDIYRLSITEEIASPLSFDDEFRVSKKHQACARTLFIDWYKDRAHQKIKARVDWHSSLFGLRYNEFLITDAQQRWASCSAKGDLRFSWRLIMAPSRVIDYVVVHELAHLHVGNHSKKFWAQVKMMLPDYEDHKNWLKKKGHLLVI